MPSGRPKPNRVQREPYRNQPPPRYPSPPEYERPTFPPPAYTALAPDLDLEQRSQTDAVLANTSQSERQPNIYILTLEDSKTIRRMIFTLWVLRYLMLSIYAGLLYIYFYILYPLCLKAKTGEQLAMEGAVCFGLFVGFYMLALSVVVIYAQIYFDRFIKKLKTAVREGQMEDRDMNYLKKKMGDLFIASICPCCCGCCVGPDPDRGVQSEDTRQLTPSERRFDERARAI